MAGLGWASACDICVAATVAVFATSEVQLGLAPTISPYVIRAIGERQAYRYFQTAERMTAARAWELGGLVHEVVALERLEATIAELAKALLQRPPMRRQPRKS